MFFDCNTENSFLFIEFKMVLEKKNFEFLEEKHKTSFW